MYVGVARHTVFVEVYGYTYVYSISAVAVPGDILVELQQGAVGLGVLLDKRLLVRLPQRLLYMQGVYMRCMHVYKCIRRSVYI